ncbi:MAG TPA: glycoside hydrolase family 31 protein [Verrucomicrobiae bacterium]|nr:glycoside hydrolase family 31 protein [Verrucomicrobiae bacterium]
MKIQRLNKIVCAIVPVVFLHLSGWAGQAADPPPVSVRNDTANGGWSSLGAMPAPAWDGRTLRFQGSRGTLAITPLSDDVFRVRFTTAKSSGRDHSYAVVNRDFGPVLAKVEIGSNATTLATASVKVTVQPSPVRIAFADSAGEILDADDPERGIAMAGPAFRVAKQLRDDEHVYGFGEKNGKLDKRGWKLGGYNYVMWNSDTFAHDSSTDPIYVSVPFYLVVRHGQAHGIFLDDTWRSTFDVGRERPDLLTFGAEGGDLDYYFINGPDPKKVLERYTALTGRMPLPPLWSLGFNQCRYSYYPESKVRWIADTFREKQIPADVLWLDIHYQDNFKPFTWDHKRFPDPKKMIADLRAQGFRVVCIVDPHPKAEQGYAPYDGGMAGNYFVKNPDGSVYEAPVWPSLADKNPGPSVFPDFSNPAARAWWGTLYEDFLELGVAGIWNDMDEPAVFNTPRGTMPLDVVFNNEGQPATHREIHNVYGQLTSRATFEGLSRLRPNERPFVLTRASFAGGQRYAAVWTGDNTSDWTSLRQSISTLLGLGLSGFPFAGCDLGGFDGAPSDELYTRWLQAGVFFPFMRSHSTWGSPDKEPWSFDYRHEIINKHAIELRYELLPYIYHAMQEASQTGVPALRPLFLEFPDDEKVAGTDDEFLFGEDLLVAPVLYEGASERAVYLPKGEWFDYWTGRRFAGGQTIHLPVTLDSIPLFVRGGGFIFRQPVVQHTGEMPGKPLRVLIAPAHESESFLYEDNGETLDYRQGAFMQRRFHQAREDRRLIVDVSGPEGTYRPAARDLVLETWTDYEPGNVSAQIGDLAADRIILPHLDAAALEHSPQGWSFADGRLTVKVSDSFKPMRFDVER